MTQFKLRSFFAIKAGCKLVVQKLDGKAVAAQQEQNKR